MIDSNVLDADIEQCLRDTGLHPDFFDEANVRFHDHVRAFRERGEPEAEWPALRSMQYDTVLMQRKYFNARLAFLRHVIDRVQASPQSVVSVADDGCGSGADLYVMRRLLGDRVSCVGIDTNDISLRKAAARVPDVSFACDLPGRPTFDVVYGDFVSIDNSSPFALVTRGCKTNAALLPNGTAMQNSDAENILHHVAFFGGSFKNTFRPRLLAVIEDNSDCYLCRYDNA